MTPSGDGTATAQRVVIVGASLAALRAAETLRAEGFGGSLTVCATDLIT